MKQTFADVEAPPRIARRSFAERWLVPATY
jgi:hypothetical protein